MKTKEFESETPEELMQKTKDYAQREGIKLNPNKKVAEAIIKGLVKNKKLKGENYCPCRIVSGNKEEDKKIICPCIYHKEEIEKDGHCKCHLLFDS